MKQFFLQATDVLHIPYYVHLIIVAAIMFTAGILGGHAGYLIERNRLMHPGTDTEKAEKDFKKQRFYFLVTGVCAAFLIPLFLSTISSQLMSDSQHDPIKYFVLGGFCLLMAIFSKRFITSLSDKLLKQLKDEVEQQTTKAFDDKSGLINKAVEKQVSEQTATIQTKLGVMDELTKLEVRIKNPNNPTPLMLDDLTSLLEEAIKSGDPDLPTQVYDKISLLCYNVKRDDLLEKINELYKDRIKITSTGWADLSISNMNKYSLTKNADYRKKSAGYIDQSLIELPDYGVAYSLRIYLLLIQYEIEGSDQKIADSIIEEMKKVFKQINDLGTVTIGEAFNYFGLNEDTGFKKYNDTLKTLLPDEWAALEKNGGAPKKP